MRTVLLAFVLTISAGADVRALDPHKRLSQFGHRVWTQQDGLRQDSIRAIAQAADGSLWIGTEEGLARFDGTEFTVFRKGPNQLASATITALLGARDGSIWIGTLAGLSRYKDGAFQHFDSSSGLGTRTVSSLIETRDGTVWAAGGLVVSSIKDGRIRNFDESHGVPPDGLRELVETADGHLWGVGIGELARLEGERFLRLPRHAELQGFIGFSVTMARDGALWIGGSRGVIGLVPPAASTRYGLGAGLPDDLVRAVLGDRNGNLWVGTNNGLARREGERFVPVAAPGLSDRANIWDLFEDRDGSLWVGTNSGLHQFREQRVSVYGTSEGFPSDQPMAVLPHSDGTLWIGYRDAGLAQLAGGRLVRFTSADGLADNQVFAVHAAKNGDLLVGTGGGFTRIHGTRARTIKPVDPLGRHNVYDVLEDAQSAVWLATNNGVFVVEADGLRSVVPGGPLLADAATSLETDSDGSLWAGTYDHGLWHHKDGALRRFTVADGLPSDAIRALHRDAQGVLWIGTAGGGLAWRRNGRFGHIASQHGLLSDNVGQIIELDEHHLWLGTSTGILRIDKQAALDRQSGTALDVLSGAGDGLRSSQCSPGYPTGGGGAADRHGRLWVITADGLAALDPATSRTLPVPGEGRVTAVFVDGDPVSNVSSLTTSAAVRRVTFRYASTFLIAPERLRYRYRLEGLDPDWIDAGARRSVDYTNLPPGRYRFVVAASVDHGEPGPPGSTILTRRAAWYETAWFPHLGILTVAAFASLVYVGRLRRLRARFALILDERNRLSRELHDTLAQGLVGISTQLSGVSTSLRTDPTVAEERLALARKMTQHSLTEARRSVMDLRASALEGPTLRSAIEHVVGEMTAGSGVHVTIRGDRAAADLDGKRQEQLLRIAQEAVHNAMKHGHPRRITVALDDQDDTTVLTVEDDGCGFEEEGAFTSSRGHFGLLGMRERARQLGGALTLESGAGRGTRLNVRVPHHG